MNNKFLISVVVGSLLLLLGTVWLAGKMVNGAQVEKEEGVKVQLSETSHDWGEIGIGNGVVEKKFEIKNVGTKTLKLFNVATSCMCTTAQFVSEAGESRKFGMHDKTDYVQEVEPGESVDVKVIFDPAFHGPDAVGPITRQVTVNTNDLNKPTVSFTLTASVIK